MDSFEVVVIGAGPGGYECALECSKLGLRVAVIEKNRLGGVCANQGCMPTKALRASAEILLEASEAKAHGIDLTVNSINGKAVLERARRIADQSSKAVGFLLKKAGVEVINGTARILDKNTIEANGKKITCRNMVIATGTRNRDYPAEENLKSKIITSDSVFGLEEIPESIAIIGGGVIGCEFASIFSAMGSKVILVELQDRLLPFMDQELGEFLKKEFARKGMAVHTGVKKAEPSEKGIIVDGTELEAGKILAAIGRIPVLPEGTEGLGINILKNRMVAVNQGMQTCVPGVYAIGDIIGGMLAHAANEHGRIAARNIAGEKNELISLVPQVIYSIPELASIGSVELGEGISIRRTNYLANSRAMTEGKTKGFAKVAIDEEGMINGAAIAGENAGELISYFTIAMDRRISLKELARTIYPHPSYSEIIKSLAE